MVNETTEVSTEITEVCQESGDRTIQQGFRAEVTEQYGDWMVARRTSHKFGKRGDSKEVNQEQNQKLTSRNNGNMTNTQEKTKGDSLGVGSRSTSHRIQESWNHD